MLLLRVSCCLQCSCNWEECGERSDDSLLFFFPWEAFEMQILFLWQHCETSADCLFKSIFLSAFNMASFSSRQRLCFAPLEYDTDCFSIDQLMLKISDESSDFLCHSPVK